MADNPAQKKILNSIVAIILFSGGMLLTQFLSYNLLPRTLLESLARILFWMQFLVGAALAGLFLYFTRFKDSKT